MKTTFTHKLLTLLLCGGMLATAGAAEARGGDRDHRGWDKHKHHYKHSHGHRSERNVYRERVVIRERPRHYRETIVHKHYYAPAYAYPSYQYSRSPAVVIGVNVPPIILPLR